MTPPLRRAVVERYGLDAQLGDGGLESLDIADLRRLALAIEEARANPAGTAVDDARLGAGDLYTLLALGELTESELERGGRVPLAQVLERLDAELGCEVVDAVLEAFAGEFLSNDATSRVARFAALVVIWLLNLNPALAPLRELFDDRPLLEASPYARVTAALGPLLLSSDLAGALGIELDSGLRLHGEAAVSLAAHLSLAADRQQELEPAIAERLLRAVDLLAEERPRPPPGPGPPAPPRLDLGPPATVAPPRESPWMAELSLIAKHTRVWLDQMSRAHGRTIGRLDEIPDDELARLAADGMTGLWLIGVWERSSASATIKRLCGDPQAEASAYAIYDYRVADSLGGDPAMDALVERALEHGIRIGVDVVPNHVGIDSRFVRDRPDWFLQVPAPPFANYTFHGPDLSGDPAIGLFLEDHYYDRSDAAVVFRRLDRATGEERFLYHGNDGTTTPWNDTAQLDYTRPEVRDAMVATIVGLARRFPILRFDAAMTLTRYHYQRLWFPAPGTGGAIPSRSEHGMSTERFAERMPEELWREVSDRVAAAAPDTLLLAEAFWLMEAFFVRHLGIHRVYNSAFMHMVRDRDGHGLRQLLAETLEVDPGILGRYVNFLSNPDEKSAAEQFGRGDRYFGACTLLATLPALPMFAHGQVDGLEEKYGMEFGRAQRFESADPAAIARHRYEIAPLLRERGRFSDTSRFALLDVVDRENRSLDDVIAIANGSGDDAAVVVFNNSQAAARCVLGPHQPGRRAGEFSAFGQLLDLDREPEPDDVLAYRERRSGVHTLRSAARVMASGLEVELAPYRTLVLDRFRVLDRRGAPLK